MNSWKCILGRINRSNIVLMLLIFQINDVTVGPDLVVIQYFQRYNDRSSVFTFYLQVVKIPIKQFGA